jgi:hypothetical protein
MISQTRLGHAYMHGIDTLGASYELTMTPWCGMTAKVDDIPTWTAIVLGAVTAISVVYLLKH